VRLYRSPDDIAGKRVVVMGLGTKDGGVGAALFAARRGGHVTVTDRKPEPCLREPLAELEGLGIRFHLDGHRAEDFETADLVIRNPGIRRSNDYLKAAARSGAAVDSPIGIFCESVTRPWIGITGTKGKSYTTHLTSHMLCESGRPSVAAGNNCVSPLRTVDDPDILHVLELSSWQLAEMDLHHSSPHVGCWLNFFPDHMNWYASMEEYRRDKEAIFRNQEGDDFLIVPLNDDSLASVPSRSGKLLFSSSVSGEGMRGSFIDEGKIVYRTGSTTITVADLDELPAGMRIPLHLDLVLPSVCSAVAAGADPESLRDGLCSFRGIPHRFQTILEREGIRAVNDSAATTPDSVVRALESLGGEKVILIAGGGGHKNLDYRALINEILESVDFLILFGNDATSEMIEDELEGKLGERLSKVEDMEEAVTRGIDLLRDGGTGTLLLSPGCSGAPFYTDLFERGRIFEKEVFERTDGKGIQKGGVRR
jgi:UDP-N-acetylmuramoylalanine--D-glutamate ligase